MCKTIKFFKKGAGSALYYISIMLLIVSATAVCVEFLNGYTHVGKTQMYADILANGGAFIGNNGFGINKPATEKAIAKLESLNSKYFKEDDISLKRPVQYMKTADKDGIMPIDENTVYVQTKLNTRTLTTKEGISKEKEAKAKIALTGGLRVVRIAWEHTYECEQNRGKGTQTKYLWGGGHGGGIDTSWEAAADCSGFVDGCFNAAGYYVDSSCCTFDLETMGRTIADGSDINSMLNKAMPGDIILYWYGDAADGNSKHVVLYAGKYNNQHYVIESHGGSSYTTPRGGPHDGAHINLVREKLQRYKVIRLINAANTGLKPYESKQVNFGSSLSAEETEIVRWLLQLNSEKFSPSKSGIAGLMGNIMNEGGRPDNIEDKWQDKYIAAYGSEERYAQLLNAGLIPRDEFVNGPDGGEPGGYGLCQWTDKGRRGDLWDFCKKNKYPIASIKGQIAFLQHELDTKFTDCKAVLTSNASPDAITEYIYYHFEIPDTETDESLPSRIITANRVYGAI